MAALSPVPAGQDGNAEHVPEEDEDEGGGRNKPPSEGRGTNLGEMNYLIWVAIILGVLWIVLRVALAVTGGFLHLLWIAAVISLVVWLVGKMRGAGGPG